MLKITIPELELYDTTTNEFTNIASVTITLEYSLLAISKWESKWNKPFLGSANKTAEECIDFVRYMTLEENINPLIYQNISPKLFEQINQYMESTMTATTITDRRGGKPNREIVTSELIYYWMIALEIPFECENWNFNRLIMLIRICNIRNGPQKKMNKKDLYAQNRALNEARKQRLGTSG